MMVVSGWKSSIMHREMSINIYNRRRKTKSCRCLKMTAEIYRKKLVVCVLTCRSTDS